MTNTPDMALQQASLSAATLKQTLALLSNPTLLGAWLCSELWKDGHHNGTYIKWPDEAARYVSDRDRARMRLCLEELGLKVSSRLLEEALLLVPAAPEDVRPATFLSPKEAAA